MILLTFLLLVSGCIYDEYDDNTNVIRFSTKVGGVKTRGLYTSEIFSNFNVTAMGSTTPYFSNLNVTKQDDGSWRTASTKYWPAYPLTFYGYAPASLQDSVVITDSLHHRGSDNGTKHNGLHKVSGIRKSEEGLFVGPRNHRGQDKRENQGIRQCNESGIGGAGLNG